MCSGISSHLYDTLIGVEHQLLLNQLVAHIPEIPMHSTSKQ